MARVGVLAVFCLLGTCSGLVPGLNPSTRAKWWSTRLALGVSPFAVAQNFSPRAFDSAPAPLAAVEEVAEDVAAIPDLIKVVTISVGTDIAHSKLIALAHAHRDVAVSTHGRRLVVRGSAMALKAFVSKIPWSVQGEPVTFTAIA